MKIGTGYIFVLLIIFSITAQAQEKDADTTHRAPDSMKLSIPPLNHFSDFEIYRKLYFMKNDVPVDNNPGTIWLWTSASISASSLPATDTG